MYWELTISDTFQMWHILGSHKTGSEQIYKKDHVTMNRFVTIK